MKNKICSALQKKNMKLKFLTSAYCFIMQHDKIQVLIKFTPYKYHSYLYLVSWG